MSTISDEPLTCDVCGCSSRWRAAFGEVKDGTVRRRCCPSCKTMIVRKHAGAMFWALAIGTAMLPFMIHGGHTRGFDLVVVSWLLIMAWSYLLVFPHEIGHVLAARLVGAPAYAVQIGQEPWLLDHSFAGLRWRIGRYLGTGLTFHVPCAGSRPRLRLIVIALGGPLMNLFIALAALLLIARNGFSTWRESLPLLTLAVASLLQFALNLWPRRISAPIGRIWSDGAQVLRRLRGQVEDGRVQGAAVHYMQGLFAFEDRDFTRAENALDRARQLAGDAPLGGAADILRAAALAETDRAPEAVLLLMPLLEVPQQPGLQAAAANNLAWCYFLLDEPEKIDQARVLSEDACAEAPWEIPFQITRACVLAASANPGNQHARDALELLEKIARAPLRRQSRAYASLCRGLVAAAQDDGPAAHAHYATAQSLHATAAPLRVLQRRLPSR